MKNILAIVGKDLRSAFVTPIAYVVITAYVFLSGFFFFTLLQQYNSIAETASFYRQSPNLNEWVVYPFFQTMEIVLIFLSPLLTMRSFSEERASGTFEMLITSPLKVSDLVLGKTVGVWGVSLIMLILSFVYPLVLIAYTDVEVMPILIGFLGMVLFTFSFLALGVAVSSFTKNQTVAGIISLVLLLVFYVIDAPSNQMHGLAASFFKYLAPANHAELMLKGVLEGSDLVYFISVILFGIFLSNRAIEAERWR